MQPLRNGTVKNRVNERKYSVSTVGSKIDEFLDPVLDQAGFDLDYEIADVESTESDFETPDVLVKRVLDGLPVP